MGVLLLFLGVGMLLYPVPLAIKGLMGVLVVAPMVVLTGPVLVWVVVGGPLVVLTGPVLVWVVVVGPLVVLTGPVLVGLLVVWVGALVVLIMLVLLGLLVVVVVVGLLVVLTIRGLVERLEVRPMLVLAIPGGGVVGDMLVLTSLLGVEAVVALVQCLLMSYKACLVVVLLALRRQQVGLMPPLTQSLG